MLEQLKADVLAANLALPRSSSGDVHLGQCQRGRRNAAMDGNQTFRRRVQRDDRRRYGSG